VLFASDKPLGLAELKRLLGERDGKKVTAAVKALGERRKGTGIEVAALSSGWHLRTNAENAAWVTKLLVGRPVRLSRAMLETLAIVAYRQPITRPEVDDIRGVDCGPVLKTLLDRGLVRIIGKKEEVGRPMLYGTTPEFLRIFNLRDLSELPTLREFYDLSTEDQSRVEAEHGPPAEPPSATSPKPDVALTRVMRGALEPEPEDTDPLLDELDEASQLAKQALGELEPTAPEPANPESPSEAKGEARGNDEPPASPLPAGE
jgi:segregation and condensation protein B